MRTAARKDSNHNEIVLAFLDLGWSVLEIYQLKNCCDLFVAKAGRTIAIEIKDGTKPPSKRKLTDGEAQFFQQWRGMTAIVTGVDDIIKLERAIYDRS